EARDRPMMNHVAVKCRVAAGRDNASLARAAGGAKRAGREIGLRASVAALEPQFARPRAIPEMLRFGRRFRSCARRLGHIILPIGGGLRPACFYLDATMDGLASTVQPR